MSAGTPLPQPRSAPMAGYSGTPLPQKLGVKAGHRVALVATPLAFETALAPLPDGVLLDRDPADDGPFDVFVFFTRSAAELRAKFGPLSKRLTQTGGLWVAWPKRASGVATDLTEDAVRQVALAAGLVDNKVCAIDDTWSGLRLVIRL